PEKAFANFSGDDDQNRRSDFLRFCEDESSWLRDYALFRVLIEQNNGSAAWDQWPPQHHTIESARNWLRDVPQEKQSAVSRRLNFFCYVQWIAHQQWRDVKTHAEQRGVALMGDIPFGVSYYSADVFSRLNEFMLDWCGGAPPEPTFKDDAFTQKWGQNWGIPLYRWSAMRENNFQWWRERVRATRRVFHLFRIDHVQGFYRVYAFPWRPEKNKEFLPLDQHQMLERTGGRAPWEEMREHPASETGQQARAILEKIALFAGLSTNSQGTAVSDRRNENGADWKPPRLDQLDYEKDFFPAVINALFRCNSWIAI